MIYLFIALHLVPGLVFYARKDVKESFLDRVFWTLIAWAIFCGPFALILSE